MKYYYARQDLFDVTWVECTLAEAFDMVDRGVPTKTEHDPLGEQLRDKELLEAIEDEISSTPTSVKEAILEELRETAPAIVSIAFDEVFSDKDFSPTQEQVEYFVDEELINPDYDEMVFDDGDELSTDDTLLAPVGSSSSNTNKWFPRAVISIPDTKINFADIQRIQRAIYTLMEGGMVHDNDELDGSKFVKRLETYRDVKINTSKKDRANPSIMFMPDFSPSCFAYANLYNIFMAGVSSIRDDFDVVSAPHFNGLPKWYVVNGVRDKKKMEMYGNDYVDDDATWGGVSESDASKKFYADAIAKRCARYDITTVIIAGDMDGTWCYKLLLDNPLIERMIWIDGSKWGDEVVPTDRTSELLYKLNFVGYARTKAKSKLMYWSAVKTVADFVRVIERSNSW